MSKSFPPEAVLKVFLFDPHLDRLTAWNTDADHMIIRTDLKLLEVVKLQERTTQKGDKELQDFPGSEPGSEERAISK